MLDRFERFLGDFYALGARFWTRANRRHPLAIDRRNLHPGDLAVQKLGVAARGQGQEPDHHRDAQRRNVIEKPVQGGWIINWLGHE